MGCQDYEYDYHNLAEDADFIDQDDQYGYDGNEDEPWMVLDEDEQEQVDYLGWENYYHNLTNEIED